MIELVLVQNVIDVLGGDKEGVEGQKSGFIAEYVKLSLKFWFGESKSRHFIIFDYFPE